MKIVYFTFLLSLLAISTYAQSETTLSNVTILEKKWRFEVRNPAEDENSLQAQQDRVLTESVQRTSTRDTPSGKRSTNMSVPRTRKEGPAKQVMFMK